MGENVHQRLSSAKERDEEISLAQADHARHVCGYMGPSHDGENIIISQKLTKYRRWKYCKQCHLDNMPRVEATMVWHCRCQYVGLL